MHEGHSSVKVSGGLCTRKSDQSRFIIVGAVRKVRMRLIQISLFWIYSLFFTRENSLHVHICTRIRTHTYLLCTHTSTLLLCFMHSTFYSFQASCLAKWESIAYCLPASVPGFSGMVWRLDGRVLPGRNVYQTPLYHRLYSYVI